MYSGKNYSLWKTLLWSKKYILYFLLIDSIPVVLYHFLGCTWLNLPWQPISLIGIAVAFYLGFKNNSSYERLWEARKIWGGIVNASRSFTVMVRDFVSNQFANEKLSDNETSELHKSIIHRHVAWLNALTYQLREPREWEHSNKKDEELRKLADIHSSDNHYEKLKAYLSADDYDYISKKGNKASHIISLQSKTLSSLRKKGLIDDFRHMELQKMLSELYTLQGKSERIKNFPFPRQYASVNFFFVWIFIFLIPFGMLNIFSSVDDPSFVWMTIPTSVLVSWVFIIMEMIGDYSENPFEGLYNDVPITSMARGIEIDIRQMLDEENLPAGIQPVGDLNILL